MTGNEENVHDGGMTYKLWKEEDFPQPPAEQVATEPTPEPVIADPQPPAEPVVEQKETPPAAEPVDIGRLISERLGAPEDEIRNQLSEMERLRKLAVEDEELVPDDDFLKNIVRSYKNGGKAVLEQYIEAMSVDFANMKPEEVVEYSIRKELGKGAPKSEITRAYKERLARMGWEEGLEPGTPEYNDFQESLTWNANNLREKLAKEQHSFKIPERQQQAAAPAIDQAAIDAYISQTRNDAASRSLLEQKVVKIGEFSLPVEPESLVGQALDTSAFLKNFIKTDGSVDYAKFYQVAAIAVMGPEEFHRKAVADAVAAEKLKWIAATKNPSEADPKPVTNESTTFKVKFM